MKIMTTLQILISDNYDFTTFTLIAEQSIRRKSITHVYCQPLKPINLPPEQLHRSAKPGTISLEMWHLEETRLSEKTSPLHH